MSAALHRLQEATGRLLKQYGGEYSFQEYVKAPNFEEFSEAISPLGDPVLARASEDAETITVQKSNGERIRSTERVWNAEIPAFRLAGKRLDENFRMTIEGEEAVIGDVTTSEDETYYVFKIVRDSGNAG